jgi:trans-feruloyl-CoA hydratase/vanillin synthase
LIACDLAIAAEEAKFGLSEINWGIIPAGNVAKAVSTVVGSREALYLIMTGELFDGNRAREYRLVNKAVPLANLEAETRALARTLAEKNPNTLRQAKVSFKNIADMDWEVADDYLRAKQEENRADDPERGRDKGMKGFLDDKSYKPGAGSYRS